MNDILVYVRGGIVQEVYGLDDNQDYVVVDVDNSEMEEAVIEDITALAYFVQQNDGTGSVLLEELVRELIHAAED